MRINLDSQALGDPRFKRLGRALNIDWREALGRCVVLWMTCYDARKATMAAADVEIVAECDGFAAAMVGAGLAEDLGADGLRIRGVADRIGFLERQRDRGRRGGVASTTKRGAQANAEALAQANAQPSSPRPLKPSQALPLPLDQDPDQEERGVDAAASPSSSVATKPAGLEVRAQELARVAVGAINAHAGTKYQTDAETTLKDCRALAEARVTTDEVCAVIASKAAEWIKSHEMRKQFRPSTLLRPSNFKTYLADVKARGGASAMPRPALALGDEPIMIGGKAYTASIEGAP